MFLGERMHLHKGSVAAHVCVYGGLSTGYVAPCARCGGRMLFSYRPSRKKKKR